MRLLMMRHGSTAGNATHRYVGRQTNEPMSEEGRAACLRAGIRPSVDVVYVSPLLRARQTAQLCFPCARICPVLGLEEYDFGIFEGKNHRDMEHDQAYRAWVDGGCVGRCPGGESRAEFVARSNAALASLLLSAAARDEHEVTVVAHGGTIMAAFSTFAHDARGTVMPGTDDYFAWQVRTCEGYVATVSIDGDRIRLLDAERFERLPAWPR